MIYIMYYYSSNKMVTKEEYESAYLSGFLNKYTKTKIICRKKELCITVDHDIDVALLKPYSELSLDLLMEDINLIKCSNSNCKIILFGDFARMNSKTLLKEYDNIDGIIVDDLETVCYLLIVKQAPLDTVKGIKFLKDNNITFRKIPRNELVDINMIEYADRSISSSNNQNFVEVQFSKGCLNNCTFCSATSKNDIRFKDIDICVNEIKYLNSKYGFKNFTIKDLSFEDRNKVLGGNQLDLFAEKIISSNLKVNYSVHFRANAFTQKDKNLLNKLRLSGLNGSLVGIESFCDEDLQLYGKNLTANDNINFIKLLRECYIEPSCSFIFIHPLTSVANIKSNIKKAFELELMAFLPPILNTLSVNKGTKIYEYLLDMNLIGISNGNPYTVELIYKDKIVQNIAHLFLKYFKSLKLWNINRDIKFISKKLNELNFKYEGNLLFDSNLINKTIESINQVNEYNYNFITKIISFCENSRLAEAENLFEFYYIDFDAKFKNTLDKISLSLSKELKGNEMIYDKVK